MWRVHVSRLVIVATLAVLFPTPSGAFTEKEPKSVLDDLVFVRPELRVPETRISGILQLISCEVPISYVNSKG